MELCKSWTWESMRPKNHNLKSRRMTRMWMWLTGMRLPSTWLLQVVMTLWWRYGIWECVKITTARNCCVSTGTMSQSLPSLSSQTKNQWSQWQARTTAFLFGTCQCRTKKKTLKFLTSWCSCIRAKKKSSRSSSIQYTLNWWPVVQLTVSICSNRTMNSLLKNRTNKFLIRRIWRDLQSRKKNWTNCWEEWTLSEW